MTDVVAVISQVLSGNISEPQALSRLSSPKDRKEFMQLMASKKITGGRQKFPSRSLTTKAWQAGMQDGGTQGALATTPEDTATAPKQRKLRGQFGEPLLVVKAEVESSTSSRLNLPDPNKLKERVKARAVKPSGIGFESTMAGTDTEHMKEPVNWHGTSEHSFYNTSHGRYHVTQKPHGWTYEYEPYDHTPVSGIHRQISAPDRSMAIHAATQHAENVNMYRSFSSALAIFGTGLVKAEDEPFNHHEFTKIGHQQGTNPGGTYKHNESGEKWYVKYPQADRRFFDSEDAAVAHQNAHAKNEVLAGKLYQRAGVHVPETKLVKRGKVHGVASKILDAKEDPHAIQSGKPHGIGHGFAADAWLGNYDSVGYDHDNMLVHPEGHVARIDHGAALRFRAQGAPKSKEGPKSWGPKVHELSLLDGPNHHQAHEMRNAARVFSNAPKEHIRAGAHSVSGIPDHDIRNIVSRHGPEDPHENRKLADTLIARRDHISNHFGVNKSMSKAKGHDESSKLEKLEEKLGVDFDKDSEEGESAEHKKKVLGKSIWDRAQDGLSGRVSKLQPPAELATQLRFGAEASPVHTPLQKSHNEIEEQRRELIQAGTNWHESHLK